MVKIKYQRSIFPELFLSHTRNLFEMYLSNKKGRKNRSVVEGSTLPIKLTNNHLPQLEGYRPRSKRDIFQ